MSVSWLKDEQFDSGQARAVPSLLLILTLLGALVAGILQRQADGTIMSCAIFPVGDDLSGRRTVSHCGERQAIRGREVSREVYNLHTDKLSDRGGGQYYLKSIPWLLQ